MIINKIDFAILKPGITDSEFANLCGRGINYRGLCVHPTRACYAWTLVDTKIISVIGFPYGLSLTKYEEAKLASRFANELDVVWNTDYFANRHYVTLLTEIHEIVELGSPVKVIVPGIEHASFQEVKDAYRIVEDSGAFCIKTLVKDPFLNCRLLDIWRGLGNLKIKVSGGIKNYDVAKHLLNRGADIIGTSTVIKEPE